MLHFVPHLNGFKTLRLRNCGDLSIFMIRWSQLYVIHARGVQLTLIWVLMSVSVLCTTPKGEKAWGSTRKYQGSTKEVRGEYKGVRGSTRKYEGVQGSMREYEGVPREYEGSTREYEEVRRKYEGSTRGVRREYEGSTKGVRGEYEEVWEARKPRFFLLGEQSCVLLGTSWYFSVLQKSCFFPLRHLPFFIKFSYIA